MPPNHPNKEADYEDIVPPSKPQQTRASITNTAISSDFLAGRGKRGSGKVEDTHFDLFIRRIARFFYNPEKDHSQIDATQEVAKHDAFERPFPQAKGLTVKVERDRLASQVSTKMLTIKRRSELVGILYGLALALSVAWIITDSNVLSAITTLTLVCAPLLRLARDYTSE